MPEFRRTGGVPQTPRMEVAPRTLGMRGTPASCEMLALRGMEASSPMLVRLTMRELSMLVEPAMLEMQEGLPIVAVSLTAGPMPGIAAAG